MSSLSPLLNFKDVCKILDLGKTTVYGLIGSGEIPHLKIRNRIRVVESDLAEYIERGKVTGAGSDS